MCSSDLMQPYGLTTGGHVQNILDLSRDETIWRWFGGGPSEHQARVDWSGWGLPLEAPGVTDVWAGIDRVSQLFRSRVLFIHKGCIGLLSEIGTYRRVVDKNSMPTDAIENKESFHLLDCLRYMVTGLLGSPVEDQEQIIYNPVRIGVEY